MHNHATLHVQKRSNPAMQQYSLQLHWSKDCGEKSYQIRKCFLLFCTPMFDFSSPNDGQVDNRNIMSTSFLSFPTNPDGDLSNLSFALYTMRRFRYAMVALDLYENTKIDSGAARSPYASFIPILVVSIDESDASDRMKRWWCVDKACR